METIENQRRIIVVTGPESTGKTELAKQLSKQLNCKWVPELSRNYVEELNRPYTYEDVEVIARTQIEQFDNELSENSEMVIFDTGLIITKVWFDVVYGRCPTWLVDAINKLPRMLHLLCDTDLPWEPDTVRENGGEMRNKLNLMYKVELEKYQFPYEIVSGKGSLRLENALKHLSQYKLL